MRSQEQQEEEDKLKELELRKRKLQIDLASIELDIRRLSLSRDERDHHPSTQPELFPIGSRVKVTNKRDPSGLYNKEATVTGHTKARVKITANRVEYSRAPSSLKLQK